MKVLGYVLKPKNITETQRDEDELYLDIASRLISEITFGDKDIKIEYDMKFHYAYPQNVIKNMNNILRYDDEFMRMQNKTHIISFKEKQERDRIEKMIRDKKININLNSKEILKKYLWTEFRLKVEKSYRIREILKDRILSYTQMELQKLNLEPYYPKISIEYKQKHKKVIGIEVADILNNLIWNGTKNTTTKIGKELFKKLNVKEIN